MFNTNKLNPMKTILLTTILLTNLLCSNLYSQNLGKSKMEKLKREVSSIVDKNFNNTQIMVDKVFSFAELGFQEIETSKYLTKILLTNYNI